MKTSAALKIVKTRVSHSYDISQENERYICLAAAQAYRHSQIEGNAYNRIVEKIEGLLGEYQTLNEWLEGHHNIPEVRWHQDNCHKYRAKMQATRHAWVDSLIAEYSAKGD